ncbi:MAG: TetR family transcriptional regulator [Burkholderiales bacterium]|nr:TetR family transcriptional regulator [Burkholderiales bacterium]
MPVKAPGRPARKRRASATRRRDAVATRERIFSAATREFASHGFGGARVDRISRRARTFDRMLYYHFGNKEQLFRVVLEGAYEKLWAAEERLDLARADPVAGVRQLVAFTWQYYVDHPEFIRLLNSENLQQGRNVRRSSRVGKLSSPFIRIIADLLARGAEQGVFRAGVDPVKLYITVAALGYFYVSNRYTLTHFLGVDLMGERERAEWLAHITDVVLAYLAPHHRGAVLTPRARARENRRN